MAFAESWVEADPDGSVATVSTIDDFVRASKRQIRERLEGDPANPNSGIFESSGAGFGGAAIVKAGSARAYAVTFANLGTLTLQDGRIAITTDTNRLYHLKTSGLIELAYAPIDGSRAFTGLGIFNAGLTVTAGGLTVAGGAVFTGNVGINGTPDRPLYVFGTGNPFKVESTNVGRQIAPIIVYRNKAGGPAIGDEVHIPFNWRDGFGNDTPHCEVGYQVDAAPGVNSVPLAFQVKTGAEGTGGYERYRITSAGHHIFGGAGNNLGVTNPSVTLKGVARGLNFEIQNESPAIVLYDRDGALDNKTWSIWVDSETLKFSLENDASTVSTPFLTVDRTATVCDTFALAVNAFSVVSASGVAGRFRGDNAAARGQLSIESLVGTIPRISFYENATFRLAIQVDATGVTFDAQNNQAWQFGGTGTATFGGAVGISTSLTVGTTITATTVTAALVGNASTATALQTARNINGVSFNGTANITVAAAAGTLTGAALAAGITASSLTSVGTLTALTVSGTVTLTAAASRIVPGATSLGFRNTADSADNILITDAGIITVRNTIKLPNSVSIVARNNLNSADYVLTDLTAGDIVRLGPSAGSGVSVGNAGGSLGFYGSGGSTIPNITGSRAGNAALASLLTSLTTLGLITNATTA